MESRTGLPQKYLTFESQCFDPKGKWTGFSCPFACGCCEIAQRVDSLHPLNLLEIYQLVKGLLEFHHNPQTPASLRFGIDPRYGFVTCTDAHTLIHCDSASASRL